MKMKNANSSQKLSQKEMKGIKKSILEDLRTHVKARNGDRAAIIKLTKAKQLQLETPNGSSYGSLNTRNRPLNASVRDADDKKASN